MCLPIPEIYPVEVAVMSKLPVSEPLRVRIAVFRARRSVAGPDCISAVRGVSRRQHCNFVAARISYG